MTLTGGHHRLTKDQEGLSKDFTCIKTARINVSKKLPRLRGWLIDPFIKSTSKCDIKGCTALSVLMSRTFGGVNEKKNRHFFSRRLFCSIDKE